MPQRELPKLEEAVKKEFLQLYNRNRGNPLEFRRLLLSEVIEENPLYTEIISKTVDGGLSHKFNTTDAILLGYKVFKMQCAINGSSMPVVEQSAFHDFIKYYPDPREGEKIYRKSEEILDEMKRENPVYFEFFSDLFSVADENVREEMMVFFPICYAILREQAKKDFQKTNPIN